MPHRLFFLLTMVSVILCSAVLPADDLRPQAPSLPDSTEPDDVCELLFLAPERPVFLRVHLRVDGRSFRAGWSDFCNRMFREFDQNGDGLLAEEEWSGIPGPDMLIDGNFRAAAQGIASVRDNIDIAPADGLITPEEFADYLATRGARPLALQALGAGEQFGNGGTVAGRNSGTGGVLFSRLDTDGDGRLSADEFAAGPRVLARVDFDDDGAFSRLELQPGRLGNAYFRPADPQRTVRPTELIDLTPGVPEEAIARQLLDRYDHGVPTADGTVSENAGNETLDRREVPLPEGLFDLLDANHDGALDFQELQHIGRHLRLGLELTVRLGQRPAGIPAAEVVDQDPELKAVVRSTGEGQVAILVAGTQLEIICNSSTAGSRVREVFLQQFKAVDSDNNNYLEKQEARRSFYFYQTFDSMDEDGDGKIFEREMLAYIGRRESASDSRCLLSVADEGRNLFEVLDSNRDGRLGPRELLAAPSRLTTWDADHDGKLSETEVPSHYRLAFGRALPNIPGLPNLLTARANGVPAVGTVSANGPAWFRKMDRNRDGDVSRREFLGSRAAFEKVDANRDGLIDAAEAGAKP